MTQAFPDPTDCDAVIAGVRAAGHDLRNHIATIQAHAELMHDQVHGPINEAQLESLEAILRSVKGQHEIVQGLRQWSARPLPDGGSGAPWDASTMKGVSTCRSR